MKASEAAFPLPIQTWVSFDRTGYARKGNTKRSLASWRKTVIEQLKKKNKQQNEPIRTRSKHTQMTSGAGRLVLV